MSAVAYLTVQSGILLSGSDSNEVLTSANSNIDPTIRFTSIVCFLAGFSDKFYLSIINVLVAKVVGGTTSDLEVDENDVKDFDFYDLALKEYELDRDDKSNRENQFDSNS